MKNILFLLLLSFTSFTNAQNLCVNKNKPDTIFTFKNGKTIKLCGSSSVDKYYSEFILAIGDSIIFEADGTQNFTIQQQGDSLILEEYKWLPVGENRTFVSALWETTIFKYTSQLNSSSRINRRLMIYNNNEVMLSINEFISANDSTPNKEEIAAKLFIASLSHKLKAEKYFYAFQTKFHSFLDGAISEEYGHLLSMYDDWNGSKSECNKIKIRNKTMLKCTTSWGNGGGFSGFGPSDILYTTTAVDTTGIFYEYFEKMTLGGCIGHIEFACIKKFNDKGQTTYIFEYLDSIYTKMTFDAFGKIIKTETIDSSQFEKEKMKDY